LDVVQRERKIDRDSLRVIANGRVYTGKQAKQLRLIDSIGTFDDAVKIASKMANIEGEPVLVREKKNRGIIDIILESLSKNEINEIKNEFKEEFLSKPILQYKFEN